MTSLRRTALLWLSGLLAAVGLASAAASYVFSQGETSGFLDSQLRQIAYYVDDTPSTPRRPVPEEPLYDPEDDFLVQIWRADGASVLTSDPGVALSRRSATGFSNETVDGEAWRTFAYVTPERTVQISQRLVVRDELAADAALRSALPILVLIPLAWLLLGLIIDRVMRRLDRLAAIVDARDAGSREPIPLEGVPTEIAPLVRAMNELLERLGQAMERQRRFVSDAAHELRTPLAALLLQIGNLRRVARGREALSRLADVEAGAHRAASMVDQLLRLARYDADAGSGPAEDVDLAALARACVAEIAPVAADAGIALDFQGEARLPVRGRAADLRVLVANLLDNAVRYTPDGGRVIVRSTRAGDGRSLLEISDSGPGIPEELRERVFERFFRAAPAEIEGSGLGLAIARSIAERHGLSIGLATPEAGGGLTVRLAPLHGAHGRS